MSEIESDYSDYESAQSSEGELHSGRRPPSRRLLWTVGVFLALLLAGIIALALIPKG